MNYDLPLVSVGMPVYNSERTIVRALESLLAQDYPYFEIIVSDNFSTDQTAEICNGYAKRDKRIRLSINEKNIGIDENFKIVCEKSTGKYFMWAAGDDYWESEFIRTLVNELESDPEAGVALCAVKRQHSDESLIDIIKFEGKYNPNNLSNIQVTEKLLTPNKKIKGLKYNLFICGLFNYEAIRETLRVSDNILRYGERAVLSQIALAYRFRYVDKVLLVKTLHRKPYHERHPNDDWSQDLNRFDYWRYYSKIMAWTRKSPRISWKNKLFILMIPYYIAYRFMYLRKKKIKKKLRKIFFKSSHKLPLG